MYFESLVNAIYSCCDDEEIQIYFLDPHNEFHPQT